MDGNFNIFQADFTSLDGTTESVPNERVEWWKVTHHWRYAQDWNLRLDEIEAKAGRKHKIDGYSLLDVARWFVGFLKWEPNPEEYVWDREKEMKSAGNCLQSSRGRSG